MTIFESILKLALQLTLDIKNRHVSDPISLQNEHVMYVLDWIWVIFGSMDPNKGIAVHWSEIS